MALYDFMTKSGNILTFIEFNITPEVIPIYKFSDYLKIGDIIKISDEIAQCISENIVLNRKINRLLYVLFDRIILNYTDQYKDEFKTVLEIKKFGEEYYLFYSYIYSNAWVGIFHEFIQKLNSMTHLECKALKKYVVKNGPLNVMGIHLCILEISFLSKKPVQYKINPKQEDNSEIEFLLCIR